MTTSIGVVREAAEGERRVALTPDGAGRLQRLGLRVLVEAGAGGGGWFDDAGYGAAGGAGGGRGGGGGAGGVPGSTTPTASRRAPRSAAGSRCTRRAI